MLPTQHIPCAYSAVKATTKETLASRQKSYRLDGFTMSLQDMTALSCLSVPESNGRVVAGTGQDTAIGCPGQPRYQIRMPFQSLQAGARFHVPHLDRLVEAAAGE